MKKLLIAVIINLLFLNIVIAEEKWEYKVYKVSGNQMNPISLQKKLNSFGLNGWELITVNPNGVNLPLLGGYFIFKKKIENDDD